MSNIKHNFETDIFQTYNMRDRMTY